MSVLVAPPPAPDPAPSPQRSTVLRLTLLTMLALVGASWGYLLIVRGGAGDLVAPSTWSRAVDFLGALLGMDTPLSPGGAPRPFLDADAWLTMARLAYETLAMSVLAIWIAVAGMLITVMAGARPRRAEGGAGRLRLLLFLVVRGGWILARAVPELVWALIFVLILPPGLLVGALALGIHNLGIVGKLCSEVVEDLDPAPARALRASGASRSQALLYGVLPQALPQFLTFALYRWEVIIRTTIVVGFVAAGGLGREFRLAMSFFHFTDVAMILATYFVLVVTVDLVAAQLRRLAR